MDPHDDRQRRARARSTWAGSLTRLEDTPEEEVIALPPARLIGVVTDLTLAAWALAGTAIPDYDRRNAPGRVVRLAYTGNVPTEEHA